MRLYVAMLLRLVPRPDVAYIVDADPEAAHKRKPEYPLEFVRTNRDAYIALSRLVRNMTVLEPLPIEETSARIKASISKKYVPVDVTTVDFSLPCTAGPSQAKTSNV